MYYPPRQDAGAWRRAADKAELKDFCFMDADKLKMCEKFQNFMIGGESYALTIIKEGYVAYEYYSPDMRHNSMRHVYSVTKSITSLLFGILLEEKKAEGLSLDSPIYPWLHEGKENFSQSPKDQITIRQLLSMTSGIPGEYAGIMGVYAIAPKANEIDYVLGSLKGTDNSNYGELAFNPGTSWDYGCANYALAGMIFQSIAGRSMKDYAKEKLFEPIGLTDWAWESFGGEGRTIYTAGEEGFIVSSRGLARLGYLLLRKGKWEGKQIVPQAYIEEATQPSSSANPRYGLGFWNEIYEKNGLPKDTFHMKGHKANLLTVIPSLDLVISRVSMGPNVFKHVDLIRQVIAAVEK